MIIDYASKVSRWKRFWASTRLARKVLVYLCLGAGLVVFVLNNVHDMGLINFQLRTIRHQRTFFGWVLTQRDTRLSANVPADGPAGQWDLLYDARRVRIASYARGHTIGQRVYASMQFALPLLNGLPREETKSFEDQFWAAAANHDMAEIQRLNEKAVDLAVNNMNLQQTTTPTSQPSIP